MTSTEDATAAPVEVDFGKGKVYRMSPMRELDQAEMLRWVRRQFVRTASDALEDSPPEERAAVLTNITMKATLITHESPEYLQMAVSLDGLAKLLELSFRQHHPEVTAASILKELMSSSVVAENVAREFKLLNIGDDDVVKKKRPTIKKKKVRKKRPKPQKR